MAVANKLLVYLHYTKKLAIKFSKVKTDLIFLSSLNIAFADDVKTYKSLYRYLFQLYSGLINWKAFK